MSALKPRFVSAVLLCLFVSATLCQPAGGSDEARIEALRAERDQLIAKVRAELAALPLLPEESAGEPQTTRLQRQRRTALLQLLAEMEARVQEENSGRTAYVGPRSKESVERAYYEHLVTHIEGLNIEADIPPGTRPALGEAVLLIRLEPDGRVSELEVVRASSKAVSARAERLIRRSSPLPAFPVELASKADRAVFAATFRFSKK
jgi:periplasmic protein TonB